MINKSNYQDSLNTLFTLLLELDDVVSDIISDRDELLNSIYEDNIDLVKFDERFINNNSFIEYKNKRLSVEKQICYLLELL